MRRAVSVSGLALTAFFLAALLLLSALCGPHGAAVAQEEPPYEYARYQLEIYVNADHSLHVQERVTYRFREAGMEVGLYIPFSYGEIRQPRVLNQYGRPVPDELQTVEWDQYGVNITYDASGEAGETTVIYDYLTYGSLTRRRGQVGLDWEAVPSKHAAPIERASTDIYLPGQVADEDLYVNASTFAYPGKVEMIKEGGDHVRWETSDIPPDASYTVICYWPPQIMQEEEQGGETSLPGNPYGIKSWDFERLDVEIEVNPDASLLIRETQLLNFHGSFSFLNRDLSSGKPTGVTGKSYGKVRFSDFAVYDFEGNSLDRDSWRVENIPGGKRIHVEFSAQDERKGFIFEYRMSGAILYYDDYDRLYYNAVSEDREVSIAHSTTQVRFPPGTDLERVDTELYVGRYSWDAPFRWERGRDGEVFWFEVEDIKPMSTYTIDLSFPKGVVCIPWQFRTSTLVACAVLSALIFLSVLGFMLALWMEKGRDEGRGPTPLVRYDPPPGLRPAMLGMLVRENPTVSDISATLVDLAVRGYVRISEIGKGSIYDKKKYAFTKRKPPDPLLLDYERLLMEGLFESGDEVTEDDLEQRFYVHIPVILNGVRNQVMQEQLFAEEPSAVRTRYTAIAVLGMLAVIPLWFFLSRWLDLGYVNLVFPGMLAALLSILVIGRFMPRRTTKGRKAYDHAQGFRRYLLTAEKDEIRSMDVRNFQDTLPYAMVLGLTGAWARRMQGIMSGPPEWYEGSGGFNPFYLAASMDRMTSNLNSTLISTPPSSSSGSGSFFSGGFGGGSAGGGFGGGGSSAG